MSEFGDCRGCGAGGSTPHWVDCPYRSEPPICGVDMYPEEPGRYICDEPASNKFPHHDCGMHHGPGVDCDVVGMMMAIDEDMRRRAQ